MDALIGIVQAGAPGGVLELPWVTEYNVDTDDIDSSKTKRSEETATMKRHRLRAEVYQIEVTWVVTKLQLTILAAALRPAAIEVKFFDPNISADFQTASMYAGRRRSSLQSKDATNLNETLWRYSTILTEN